MSETLFSVYKFIFYFIVSKFVILVICLQPSNKSLQIHNTSHDHNLSGSVLDRAVETHFKKPRFFRFFDFQVRFFTFSCKTL